MAEDKVGTLTDQAQKRKERLLALKRKADDAADGGQDAKQAVPKPIFRSYKPTSEALEDAVLPRAEPGKIEESVQSEIEEGQTTLTVDEVDIMNLAPRKPDWDLKRDIAKKLDKLEKRTQRSIAELIRERLNQGKEDLSTAVNAGYTARKDVDSDED